MVLWVHISALHEGCADVVASLECLPVPRTGLGFFLFSSFDLVASAAFFCKKNISKEKKGNRIAHNQRSKN
jgi:hypothetical protein